MEMENSKKIDLNYIKTKILTINDVWNFCLLEGKLVQYKNFRIVFSKTKKLYCGIFLSVFEQ